MNVVPYCYRNIHIMIKKTSQTYDLAIENVQTDRRTHTRCIKGRNLGFAFLEILLFPLLLIKAFFCIQIFFLKFALFTK